MSYKITQLATTDTSGNVTEGLSSAKTSIMNMVKPAVNTVFVPLLAAVIGCFLLIFIGGAVNRHKGGEDYKDKVIEIIIALVALVLVLSFPSWGWTMIGD